MKKTLYFGLCCSALFLSACSPIKSPVTTDSTTPVTSPVLTEKRSGIVTVALSEQQASGQSGTAVFEDLGGKTKVTLTLTGGDFTEPQPAHIHTGACPTPGAVKHPLTNVIYGLSETVVEAEMSSLLGGGLALNVHKSSSDPARYTACGDLLAPTSETTRSETETMMDAPAY